MGSPHWCPPGYAPVELIPGMVVEWMLQGVTFKIGDEFAPWSGDNWLEWIRAEREGDRLARGREKMWTERFQTRLGRALAYAELPASGVLLSGGGLVRVTPTAWIMSSRLANGPSHSGQFEMALTGSPISAKTPPGEDCWPMVALSDLAVWAGASVEFKPPTIVPMYDVNAAPPQESSTALSASEQSENGATTPGEAALLGAWMNGYARAFKQFNKGYVIQREAAIEAVKEHHKGCSVRAARAAYKDLPYPDLRNPPPEER